MSLVNHHMATLRVTLRVSLQYMITSVLHLICYIIGAQQTEYRLITLQMP